MTGLAIIGGTGLENLPGLDITREEKMETPWGDPSAPLVFGEFSGIKVIFLARHGNPHSIPPHRVNYRANIWGLKESGISNIISVNAVGGITKEMFPGRLVVPDQIIDYTWSRGQTYFEEMRDKVVHVDFTNPFSELLRKYLITAGENSSDIDLYPGGTYGVTQGPRLETAAEIQRMQGDGCDIVGMTVMPEAVLARELKINYVSCSLVVNWAAGISCTPITMKIIEENLKAGICKVNNLLSYAIPMIGS